MTRSDRQGDNRCAVAAVMPSFREGASLISFVSSLVDAQAFGVVVLADSTPDGEGRQVAHDAKTRFASRTVDVLLDVPRGRARQMNHGARAALSRPASAVDSIAFVHADTLLPENAAQRITQVLIHREWGRFDVRLDGTGRMFRVIETMMNLRSRYTGICTGDQVIFMRRDAFEAVGGFPDQVLMEDIEISRRLKKRFGNPGVPTGYVTTSARRWQQNGVWRTIFLMWGLRLAYFFGVDPETLSRWYANVRR